MGDTEDTSGTVSESSPDAEQAADPVETSTNVSTDEGVSVETDSEGTTTVETDGEAEVETETVAPTEPDVGDQSD
jgi:hypothetical protein